MTRPPTRYLFGNGSLDDALAVFDGYDAAMDEPVMLMYEEIMAAFPEAKFLLTISDAERWFENYVELSRELRATGTISSKAFFTVCLETAHKCNPGAAILPIPVQKTRTLA